MLLAETQAALVVDLARRGQATVELEPDATRRDVAATKAEIRDLARLQGWPRVSIIEAPAAGAVPGWSGPRLVVALPPASRRSA